MPFRLTMAFAAALTLLLCAAESHASPIPVTNGLESFYSFDTDGSDLTGNGNDLVQENGSFFGSGDHAHMVGTDKRLVAPSGNDPISQISDAVTASFWVHAVSGNDRQHGGFKLLDRGRSLGIKQFKDRIYYNVAEQNSTSGSQYTFEREGYNVDNFGTGYTHVVGTFEANTAGDNFKLYLTPDSDTSVASPIISAHSDTDFVGDFSNFSIRGFRTDLDGYAIYDRALSSSEIEQLFDAGRTIDAVPEPASLALLGLGGGLMVFRRRGNRASS